MTGDLSIDDLCAVLEAEATADDAAPAAAHARGIKEPECRSTRAAMHDYLTRRLPARRARRLEFHLDGCARCIRAFIDIREASWARRASTGSSALTVTQSRGTARLSSAS
jgi:hypothetical protein